MKFILLTKKYKICHFSLVLFISLLFHSCQIFTDINPSKQFMGILNAYLRLGTILNNDNGLNNATLLLTGFLTDSTDNPLINYKLTAEFNLLRQAIDKSTQTNEIGFFSLNLIPGIFTVQVLTPSGDNIGFFDVQLFDTETDPVIVSTTGNFRISGLTAQPFLGECASICGDIMGIHSGGNDENLLVIGHEKDFPTLLISTDEAKTFSRYPITVPDCNPVNNSSERIGCRLFYAGFDGSNYLVIAGKTICSIPTPGSYCISSSIILYMGVSQDPSNINLFSPPFASQYQIYFLYNFPENSFYFKNNYLFFNNSSYSNNLVMDTSGNVVSTLPESCGSIYYVSNTNQVWCDLKSFFDFNTLTWTSKNFYLTNQYMASFLDGSFKTIEMIYDSNGGYNYQFDSYDFNLNKTFLSSLIVNQMGGYPPSTIKKAGSIYKSLHVQFVMDPEDPYKSITKLFQLKSNDGATYFNSSIRFPLPTGDLNQITGFITHKNKFYISGISENDPSNLKSYLLRSNPTTTESKWRALPIR